MDESKEELEFEPLFDYSRVQPTNFVSLDDDDSDSENPFGLSSKRMKRAESASSNVVNAIVDDKDEEDWLPPPPLKASNGGAKVALENSTIKELRLKKQELASFAQSAEDVLRTVEESVRKQLASSLQSSLESEAENVSKPEKVSKAPDEREKIVITIQDKEDLKQYRMYKDEKFERIFKLYAEKVKLDLGKLVFFFDGDKVSVTASPSGLGMEDEDIIEVHIKSS